MSAHLRFLLVAACTLVAVARGQAPPPAAARPNIVSIVTDDQARWSLGCYGNRESRTPNLDRIARAGARFDNAFVAPPVCSPSRAAFLPGPYRTQLGNPHFPPPVPH